MQKLFLAVAILAVFSVANGQKLTHSEALGKLSAVGVSLVSSGNCSDRNDPTCTSLDQIRSTTIDGVVTLKEESECAITVTGGTEVGHTSGTYSHYNGYKVDLSLNDCLQSYVTGHFFFIGNRPGDGAPQFQSAEGNVYAKEGNHWDITYYY